ncbi:MAG: hypothetical protein ACRDND_01240 [Streptosporangiaceae bacterium]
MNQQEREEIAELLLEVYASHEPVEPLTAKFAGLTLADAYEIQLLQVRRWLDGGARVKGHKVGLTSAAMRRGQGDTGPWPGRSYRPGTPAGCRGPGARGR